MQKIQQPSEIYGVQGVQQLFPESRETKGVATISKFEFKHSENPLYNFRAVMNSGEMFRVHDGKYVRLHINGQLMMSDTGMERASNRAFIKNANGHVLIAGLGVGLIVYNILSKPSVTKITIVEKYQDVIDLVAPHFTDPRIEIVCADIMEHQFDKAVKFDTIYFDIWPTIDEDNLLQIRTLHNRYKGRLNRQNPNCWMDSWMKTKCQSLKRQRW